MKRHCIAVAASLCAFALVPGTALADTQDGGLVGGLVKQVQAVVNQNETTQTADSSATSQQTNINAPVSILSSGSNDGDVQQSNNANTSASSQNSNSTDQGNEGGQGSNSNKTDQTAESSATNRQTNINAPVSILSSGSNDGDVHQSNNANTRASSQNSNTTDQGNGESKGGRTSGNGGGEPPRGQGQPPRGQGGSSCSGKGDGGQGNHGKSWHGKRRHGKGRHGRRWHRNGQPGNGQPGKGQPGKGQPGKGQPGKGNGAQWGDHGQSASNTNSTTQKAGSKASNRQSNDNAPTSILSSGSNDGGVHQSNDANTRSSSANSNKTDQDDS